MTKKIEKQLEELLIPKRTSFGIFVIILGILIYLTVVFRVDISNFFSQEYIKNLCFNILSCSDSDEFRQRIVSSIMSIIGLFFFFVIGCLIKTFDKKRQNLNISDITHNLNEIIGRVFYLLFLIAIFAILWIISLASGIKPIPALIFGMTFPAYILGIIKGYFVLKYD